MNDLLIGLIFLLFLLGLSLIFPLILVLKWQDRPALALVIATLLCTLSLAALLKLSGMAVGVHIELEFLVTIGVLGVIFGLPILAIAQWIGRRKRKGLTKKVIEEVF